MNNTQENRPQGAENHDPYGQTGPQPPYGHQAPSPRDAARPYKSAALATWLSLFPGMGQVYLGYYQLGFTYVMIMAVTITVLNLGLMEPFFGPLLAFFWIFNLLDANRRAQNYNRALDGMSPDQIDSDFEMPAVKGSTPLGVLLVVAGVLILLDLQFGVSLEWLEDWWPVALIAGGAWLVLKDRRRKG